MLKKCLFILIFLIGLGANLVANAFFDQWYEVNLRYNQDWTQLNEKDHQYHLLKLVYDDVAEINCDGFVVEDVDQKQG